MLSVVLPTRDRPDLLERALRTLMPTIRPDDEVIVVDSASVDPRVRTVAEAAGARYVRCDEPGAARARNAGCRAATHELIAFTDDDVLVSANWVEAMEKALLVHTDRGFITGRVEEPPDDPASVRPVATTTTATPLDIDKCVVGPVGQSANLGIHRHAFDAVGGFDELLGPGGSLGAVAEDSDLFDRLVHAGYPGRYDPSVLAYHVQWRDHSALLRLDWHYGLGCGYRMAKLLRTDRSCFWRVSWDLLYGWGFRLVVRSARFRAKFEVLTNSVRILGMLAGFSRGLRMRVRSGHLEPRR